MDVPDSQPIYQYWVEVTDRRDGSVRTLPFGAVQRIHLVAGKDEAPRPTEQVLQLKDPAGVLEAKNLDELVAKLRERYPDETHERFLRRERDPEAEQRRAAAIDSLVTLVARAAWEDVLAMRGRRHSRGAREGTVGRAARGKRMKSKKDPSTPKRVSVPEFRRAISRLPADKPTVYPGKTYRTQKEHWMRWLQYYNTEGAYGRIPGLGRDARYAYNHTVEPKMLVWLLPAAGVNPKLVRAARAAAAKHKTMMAQSGAIRGVVPWETVQAALWPNKANQAGSERKNR